MMLEKQAPMSYDERAEDRVAFISMKRQNKSDGLLARAPGTSLHRQLFVILRDQIIRGVYQPGAMIPNEEALCLQFEVSRITVRRAVADLESIGLLQKRHGRGTFVSDSLPPSRPSATLGFIDVLRKTANETEVEVVKVEREEPAADIARQLDLVPPAKAMHVVRLRSYQSTPVMITEAWIPLELGRTITAKELKKRALYEILIEQGVQFGRVVQEITAVAANPLYAKLLQTELSAPLLKLTRLLYDTRQQPAQHLTVYVSPERSRILMDVSIEAVNTFAAGSFFHDVTHSAEPPRRQHDGSGSK
jgi:GntR family transcriptional regulator